MLFRLIALAVLAPLAVAGTLHVPQQFETIQAAVDEADPGDTILVHKGIYPGTVTLDGRSDLVLRGTGHPVIDAAELDHGLLITGCTNVTVKGFDVESALLAGIRVHESTGVTVARCRIVGEQGEGGWSIAGVEVAGGADLVFDRNLLDGAVVDGFRFYNDGNPEATGCTLTRNTVHDVWHACVELRGSGHLVERNVFFDSVDAAIFCDASSTTLRRNKIRDSAFGITVFAGEGATLERNSIRDTGLHGIHVQPAATGTVLVRNTIVDSGDSSALRLDGDGRSCDGDRLIRPRGAGVETTGDGNTLTGVRVSSAVGDAFQLGGNTATVTDCRASKAGEDGFHVTGESNDFEACRAKGSAAFDLNDAGDANAFVDCSFVTEAP